MKTKLLTLALAIVSLTTLGQGKVTFGNDSLHLLIFDPIAFNLPFSYQAYAGQPVPQIGNGDVIANFTGQMYAGTTPDTMTLQFTKSGFALGLAGLGDGRISSTLALLTGVPASTPAYFQLRFFETAAGSFENAVALGYVRGGTPVFTVVPGSFAYNSLVLHGAPGLSTWADSPVVLSAVPEPSVVALAALSTGVMFLVRRRQLRGV